MKLTFRIHDVETDRLRRSEAAIRRLVREYGFTADVYQVQEILEHGRLGIDGDLPALEINGVIAIKKQSLDEASLRPIFDGLYAYQQKMTSSQ